MDLIIGDWVYFIYAQPGNETTYCIITEIKGDEAKLYDPSFDLFVDVKISRLKKISEEQLNYTIVDCDYGHLTIRELLEKGRDILAGKIPSLKDKKKG